MTADSSEQDPTKSGEAGPDGLGRDGIVADSARGVGLGAGMELNTFEPEEEPEAVAQGAEDRGDKPCGALRPGPIEICLDATASLLNALP